MEEETPARLPARATFLLRSLHGYTGTRDQLTNLWYVPALWPFVVNPSYYLGMGTNHHQKK